MQSLHNSRQIEMATVFCTFHGSLRLVFDLNDSVTAERRMNRRHLEENAWWTHGKVKTRFWAPK